MHFKAAIISKNKDNYIFLDALGIKGEKLYFKVCHNRWGVLLWCAIRSPAAQQPVPYRFCLYCRWAW